MPDFNALGTLVTRIGVEPAIIAGLLYLVWKLSTDKSVTQLTCSVNDLANAVDKLTEYVRGQRA